MGYALHSGRGNLTLSFSVYFIILQARTLHSALQPVGERVEAQRAGVSDGELPVGSLEQAVVGAPVRVRGRGSKAEEVRAFIWDADRVRVRVR